MMRCGADAATADDLVQDTLLTVWRKAALYASDRGSIATWVFTIARNLRIDRLRRELPWQQLPEERLMEASGDLPADEVAVRQGAPEARRRRARRAARRAARGRHAVVRRRPVAQRHRRAAGRSARHRQVAHPPRLPAHPPVPRGPAMSIAHHLDDATLMSLAAGTLTPALAVVAASHVALCPHCRHGLAARRGGRWRAAGRPRADPSLGRAAAHAASRCARTPAAAPSRASSGELPAAAGSPGRHARSMPCAGGRSASASGITASRSTAPTAASCTSFAPRPVTACRRTATTAPS